MIANILYVGGTGSNNYTTIQEAIDFATPGDTVYVYNKTYYENILINKSINLTGKKVLGRRPVIDGSESGHVVHVDNVNYFNMSGFEVRNSSKESDCSGIYIDSSSNINIINNIIDNNRAGIDIVSSSFINVQDNEIYNNEKNGIWFLYSQGSIFGSNISYNGGNGLCTYGGTLHVEGNVMENNWAQYGIFLQRDNASLIVDNYLANNGGSNNWGSGIVLAASNGTFLRGNTMVNNVGAGLHILGGPWDPIIVENATIFGNPIGIFTESNVAGSYVINSSINSTEYDIRISLDDYPSTETSNISVINTTFDKNKVLFMDTKSHLSVEWYMHVRVINTRGFSIPWAQVQVEDVQGHLVYSGTTDHQGYLRWLVVRECNRSDANGDHDGLDPGEIIMFTPHNVTASKNGVTGYALPNPSMNESKTVMVVLDVELPPSPPEVRLTTKLVHSEDILLNWTASDSQFLDHYLVYRSTDQREFDFSAPIYDTSSDMFPLRTNWTDIDAANQSASREYYYIVRAVTQQGITSNTSNTAGKWTITFGSGTNTFSLPLEPFVRQDAEFYCQDMNASYIKWMNETTLTWMRHERGDSENNTTIEMGKGYEIGFEVRTEYTFTGMPGAMILYDNIPFGFDATPLTGNADSLTAVVDPLSGDVDLNWDLATGIDTYYVYNSSRRDGFWGILGVDYYLLTTRPLGNESCTHTGAALDGRKQYYMVVPFNTSGVRGTSTYSIGIWTEEYLEGYDTFAIPLKLNYSHCTDWFCDSIAYSVGINYYIYDQQRWCWHSMRMPAGAYDPMLEMTEGYQISTSGPTKFTFIGI